MKRARNPGWFRRGHDPRRKAFTSETARKAGRLGFASYLAAYGEAPQWLIDLIKGKARHPRLAPCT